MPSTSTNGKMPRPSDKQRILKMKQDLNASQWVQQEVDRLHSSPHCWKQNLSLTQSLNAKEKTIKSEGQVGRTGSGPGMTLWKHPDLKFRSLNGSKPVFRSFNLIFHSCLPINVPVQVTQSPHSGFEAGQYTGPFPCAGLSY